MRAHGEGRGNLGRTLRLCGEDGPGQAGPGGQRKRGSGERGRALCGREAPGWLTGGPDWDGASRAAKWGERAERRCGVGRPAGRGAGWRAGPAG